jgi:ADP-ribosylglycohydrolase
MRDHIAGSLLGTAVGDALGLPYEGLSRSRALRLLGPPDRFRFLLGRGMVSDDTEHTCMVAQSLIASGGNVTAFSRQLAWRLRLWLLGLPAGVGLATLRALLRLWVGFSPERSGVFSAGNGPAMRTPILGAAVDDLDLLRQLVRASTRITHTDPKAEHGALAVALAARMARRHEAVEPQAFVRHVEEVLGEDAAEFHALLAGAAASVTGGQSTPDFAEAMGLKRGVTGYVYHTVPVVLHAWLRHPGDFRAVVSAVIECAGDTDTTAAIAGGIAGASTGREGLPEEWLGRLWEWPRTVTWLERLAGQLADSLEAEAPARPLRLPLYGVLPRNLLFLVTVLGHGVRRLFPPY